MATVVRGVILVGHGGIAKDCPPELITKLKRLEAQRRDRPADHDDQPHRHAGRRSRQAFDQVRVASIRYSPSVTYSGVRIPQECSK